MSKIQFIHINENGTHDLGQCDAKLYLEENAAKKAAQAFIDWARENPDASTRQVLHRFIDLPGLAQERLGAAIEAEAKRRGL
tara:strand:+ start:541 stop:786 length:246 start_codon:yes stop_codon:yes gene_type:complete